MPMILMATILAGHVPVPIPATEGLISTFGGPHDSGVKPTEQDWAGRFLCRALGTEHVKGGDPYYIAMRWFRSNDPPEAFKVWRIGDIKSWYCRQKIAVLLPDRSRAVVCWVADWGPNEKTGRVADLGPAVADYLELDTDETALFRWVDPRTQTGPYRLEDAGTDHAHFVREEVTP